MRRLARDERGQVAPLVAVCLLGFMAIAGLVIDGGMMFSTRRGLQALADGAARAGAMAVDEEELRNSEAASLALDPDAARFAAENYLEAAGFAGSTEIEADRGSVTVQLFDRRRTTHEGT